MTLEAFAATTAFGAPPLSGSSRGEVGVPVAALAPVPWAVSLPKEQKNKKDFCIATREGMRGLLPPTPAP